ncbi:hypothetical protein TSOC_014798 [Tetrabaena socialis]|uniref:Uncharacterized protein n=1 Tax=Tetrabaena socialis TaxID=47790 RepID=A0A2J7ZGM5_9CHLO|nr:hypothetical protein TSOC_014798 [Tetrabaena socialis]|eukprot:PNG99424.1 hypothetical protein TSOC_014798 [Tetrabaena socialis]
MAARGKKCRMHSRVAAAARAGPCRTAPPRRPSSRPGGTPATAASTATATRTRTALSGAPTPRKATTAATRPTPAPRQTRLAPRARTARTLPSTGRRRRRRRRSSCPGRGLPLWWTPPRSACGRRRTATMLTSDLWTNGWAWWRPGWRARGWC